MPSQRPIASVTPARESAVVDTARGSGMDQRMQRAEERIAEIERIVEELSDVLARQDREISQLRRRLSLLLEREAERAAEAGGGVTLADERPPHW